MDLQRLCLGCMQEMPYGAQVCPSCSRNVNEPQHSPLLAKKTVVAGRYLVGLCVSSSTDSVVYSAFDMKNERRVFLCEFLPKNLVIRGEGETTVRVRIGYDAMYASCFQSFVELWKTLMELNGTPALPVVKEILSANSTAYAVYESVDCITFEEYLSSNEKKLDWKRIKFVFKPVLAALVGLSERGIVHAAVSPQTILVGADGKLHLSGFSIPQTKSDVIELRSVFAFGYSPLELSDRRLNVGGFTDVYSVMAVMYTALTGARPQNAADRAVNDMMVIPHEYAQSLPKSELETMMLALKVYPEARLRSVSQLYARLYSAPEEEKTAEKSQPQSSPSGTDKPANRESPTKKPTEVKPESVSSIAFKVIFTVVVVAAMVFVTAYSTALYKYFSVPFLDDALSAMSFLPMNAETTERKEESTTEEKTTADTAPSVPSDPVIVGDFTGRNYRDIVNNETFKNNFEFEYTFEPSSTVEKNFIISQSVSTGKTVQKGTKIELVVSSGKPYVVLKDVAGMQYAEAYDLLTKDGFEVQKVLLENNGKRESGTVYTMSLVAGLEFEEGTTVTLSVWE